MEGKNGIMGKKNNNKNIKGRNPIFTLPTSQPPQSPFE
jgi:hypothetical protein